MGDYFYDKDGIFCGSSEDVLNDLQKQLEAKDKKIKELKDELKQNDFKITTVEDLEWENERMRLRNNDFEVIASGEVRQTSFLVEKKHIHYREYAGNEDIDTIICELLNKYLGKNIIIGVKVID